MMMIIIVFIIMTATIVIMEGKLIFVNKVQPLGELERGWWRGRKLHLQTEVFINTYTLQALVTDILHLFKSSQNM